MTWLFWLAVGSLVGGFVGLANITPHLGVEHHDALAQALWDVVTFSGYLIFGNSLIAVADHFGLFRWLAQRITR